MLPRTMLVSAVGAVACLVAATAAASRPQDDSAALRRMLAAQPDHRAAKTTIMFAGDHAFGGKSRIAKLGERHVEDNGSTLFLREAGKPTVKIYHDRRQYAELPPEETHDFAFGPEGLAARDGVTFRLSGKEKVGRYDTLKIEASYPVGNQKELRVVFYAAPALKNLVVREEYYAGQYPITVSFLEDVSLDVPEELFAVPRGYARVVEKAQGDPAGELLERLRTPGPAGGKGRRPKPRRD